MSKQERRTTNVFNSMEEHVLKRLIAQSRSISHVFDQLQLRKSGASFRIFRAVIGEKNIDTSHFCTHGNLAPFIKRRNIEEVFQNGSKVANTTLRSKIMRNKLIPYQCKLCDNRGEWLGKPIVLQVDHIDGNRNNNCLENLRFLCPNCHSQTETFCGRVNRPTPHCPECGREYRGAGRRCRKCSAKLAKRASGIQWPADEILASLVWEKPLTTVAIELKCSLTALRKQCRRKQLKCPPMGYWERLRQGYSKEEALVSQKKIRPKAKRLTLVDIERAKELITRGLSLRKVAKIIGFGHQSLARRLKGDPVLEHLTHGKGLRFNKLAVTTVAATASQD